jgi:hypothetical protein
MIRFYLNRELAQKLGFKLSRWKRWSREFLPPDPLGGLQSGFARQYTRAEAFQVYLGGHLVSNQMFSIPETKIILEDLKEWVTTQYFAYPVADQRSFVQAPAREYRIFIFMNHDTTPSLPSPSYLLRRLIDEERTRGKGSGFITERYIQNWLKLGDVGSKGAEPEAMPDLVAAKILYITKVYQMFEERLQE